MWGYVLGICWFIYFGTLIGISAAVALRSGEGALWTWRILGFSMLLPWHFVARSYLDNVFPPPPGIGDVLWATGSTLIGCAIWTATPRKV
jgi:hypothetical protein